MKAAQQVGVYAFVMVLIGRMCRGEIYNFVIVNKELLLVPTLCSGLLGGFRRGGLNSIAKLTLSYAGVFAIAVVLVDATNTSQLLLTSVPFKLEK